MRQRQSNILHARAPITLTLTVVLIVGGCATPYRSEKRGTGFSEFRITDDTFSVTFRANSATREERVDKYILRRASELTLEHGFQFFVVLTEKGRDRTSSIGYSGVKFPVITPGKTIRIRCFRGRPPDEQDLIEAAGFMRYNYPEAYEEGGSATESTG